MKSTRGWYHGGRRLSSDDSFHSPTVIPPSALDKPSIMMRYHRRRTCSHTSPRRSLRMVTLHDTRFVECRWWNDGWTGRLSSLEGVGLHDTGPWFAVLLQGAVDTVLLFAVHDIYEGESTNDAFSVFQKV